MLRVFFYIFLAIELIEHYTLHYSIGNVFCFTIIYNIIENIE